MYTKVLIGLQHLCGGFHAFKISFDDAPTYIRQVEANADQSDSRRRADAAEIVAASNRRQVDATHEDTGDLIIESSYEVDGTFDASFVPKIDFLFHLHVIFGIIFLIMVTCVLVKVLVGMYMRVKEHMEERKQSGLDHGDARLIQGVGGD